MIPLSLLVSRLTSHSSFSLLCQMLQSLSPFVGLTPVCSHLSRTGKPSTGPSTSDLSCQSREKGSLPSICYQHFCVMQSRAALVFLAAKANYKLMSRLCVHQDTQDIPCKFFPDGVYTSTWIIPLHGQDMAFTIGDL